MPRTRGARHKNTTPRTSFDSLERRNDIDLDDDVRVSLVLERRMLLRALRSVGVVTGDCMSE